jgi:predicted nucleic acid-binding protein
MSLAFFDTNILVYTEDARVPDKQRKATRLVEEHWLDDTAVLSLQVLQEYFATVTQKLNAPLERAQRRVEIFASAKVVRFDTHDVIAAIELHRLVQVSFWDALILHAARSSGAAVLYSEDFQHGAVLASVRVVNPFLTDLKK